MKYCIKLSHVLLEKKGINLSNELCLFISINKLQFSLPRLFLFGKDVVNMYSIHSPTKKRGWITVFNWPKHSVCRMSVCWYILKLYSGSSKVRVVTIKCRKVHILFKNNELTLYYILRNEENKPNQTLDEKEQIVNAIGGKKWLPYSCPRLFYILLHTFFYLCLS